jgi:hypothetical protein
MPSERSIQVTAMPLTRGHPASVMSVNSPGPDGAVGDRIADDEVVLVELRVGHAHSSVV